MESNIRKMKYEDLLDNYTKNANNIVNNPVKTDRFAFLANQYLAEMKRRDSEKSNKIMRFWTIIIGMMTLVMTVATLVNLLIALGCIG